MVLSDLRELLHEARCELAQFLAGSHEHDAFDLLARIDSALDAPNPRDARIAELELICIESYQVVGALAHGLGAPIEKAMDNLSQRRLVHEDVLPFATPDRAARIAELERENAELRADRQRLDWWERNLHVHHSRIGMRLQMTIGALETPVAFGDTLRELLDAARKGGTP
jgi:hypothetical protein